MSLNTFDAFVASTHQIGPKTVPILYLHQYHIVYILYCKTLRTSLHYSKLYLSFRNTFPQISLL